MLATHPHNPDVTKKGLRRLLRFFPVRRITFDPINRQQRVKIRNKLDYASKLHLLMNVKHRCIIAAGCCGRRAQLDGNRITTKPPDEFD